MKVLNSYEIFNPETTPERLEELADHSIACVEIQKVGYMFPGQRSACYSADMLLRQYKRVRSRKQKAFSYKHIKNAYTIIFIERSTKEFHQFPEEYLHYFTQKSDTGLELNLLQEYYFVPLDIFRKTIQNKGIQTKLDAWLTFLTSDEPEMILELIVSQNLDVRFLTKPFADICWKSTAYKNNSYKNPDVRHRTSGFNFHLNYFKNFLSHTTTCDANP